MPYYGPYYYPQQQPIMQQQPMVQQPSQQISQPQIQNSGFLSVPNEDMALNYPVAPGNCVTFKIEGKPIVMEKSMGFSQLESPKIKRYRLVEEAPILPQNEPEKAKVDYLTTDVFKSEIGRIWDEIEVLKKKEVSDDEAV